MFQEVLVFCIIFHLAVLKFHKVVIKRIFTILFYFHEVDKIVSENSYKILRLSKICENYVQ